MTKEEKYLIKAVIAARTVQNFLWGKPNGEWGVDEWIRMFRKRVIKLEEIKKENPHASVEMKKRLLQTAALCVALMKIIDKKGIPWIASKEIQSNLSQYSSPLKRNKNQ